MTHIRSVTPLKTQGIPVAQSLYHDWEPNDPEAFAEALSTRIARLDPTSQAVLTAHHDRLDSEFRVHLMWPNGGAKLRGGFA